MCENIPVDWLRLPRDLMIQIFLKIGTIDLLFNAQHVCSSWREIAKDSELYRVIDFSKPNRDLHAFDSLEKAAMLAINRSRDGLVKFSIKYVCTEAMLDLLVAKSPKLTCLQLSNCYFDYDNYYLQVIQFIPLLEELEFISPVTKLSYTVFIALGRGCTKLRSFRFNHGEVRLSLWGNEEGEEDRSLEYSNAAFVIAGNLNPALRSLHLLGDSMDNDGLEAILKQFTQLEYLDLRLCSNLDSDEDLLKKCQGIKTLRLPNDSIQEDDDPWYNCIVSEQLLNEGSERNYVLKLLSTLLDRKMGKF